MTKPSWGTVSTINEPLAVTLTFVAHHLTAGAKEVHLYLDEDNPETVAALRSLERVHVEVCDREYWRREFDIKPPKTHQRRQSLNATRSYRTCNVDYLLHLDADEFLWQFRPLEQELSSIEEGFYLNIPNVERVYLDDVPEDGMYSKWFRRSAKQRGVLLAEFASDKAGLTRNGLTGHCAGKSVTPTGCGYQIGIHRPRFPGRRPWSFPEYRQSRSSVILHFEGLTPLGWAYKRLRKAHFVRVLETHPIVEATKAQIEAMGGGGLEAGLALHRRLQVLDAEFCKRLAKENLLLEVGFDPEKALQQWFEGITLDLSAAAYDRWILQHQGHFLEADP